jgi:putative ABC transport system substrate-binding protein
MYSTPGSPQGERGQGRRRRLETRRRLPPVGLLLVLTLGVLITPLAAAAQPSRHIPRVGVLNWGPPPPEPNASVDAFLQGLHDLGYREGHNLIIDYRFAAWPYDRFPTLAAELAALQPDVIVTASTPGVQAAQQATTTIPIVVAAAGDLVTQGLVASYARPGGNITGLTYVTMPGKHYELLKEAVPTTARVAHLINAANPAHSFALRDPEAEGRALGMQVQRIEVRHADELDTAFRAIVAGGADALVVHDDAMLMAQAQATRIAAFALQHRLPTMGPFLGFARAGGLMAYNASVPDMFRRAAGYVDKILKGAKPADLPIERADKFVLVINLKTAQALGITIPPTLLLLADEVIQ